MHEFEEKRIEAKRMIANKISVLDTFYSELSNEVNEYAKKEDFPYPNDKSCSKKNINRMIIIVRRKLNELNKLIERGNKL